MKGSLRKANKFLITILRLLRYCSMIILILFLISMILKSGERKIIGMSLVMRSLRPIRQYWKQFIRDFLWRKSNQDKRVLCALRKSMIFVKLLICMTRILWREMLILLLICQWWLKLMSLTMIEFFKCNLWSSWNVLQGFLKSTLHNLLLIWNLWIMNRD